jgi:predicted branched-subunit amino acid permease
MAQERSSGLAGVQAVIPLVLGYFPIAFSFGVAATRSGLTPLEAFSLSLIVFAGAAQFLAIALLASGAARAHRSAHPPTDLSADTPSPP